MVNGRRLCCCCHFITFSHLLLQHAEVLFKKLIKIYIPTTSVVISMSKKNTVELKLFGSVKQTSDILFDQFSV